MKKLVLTTVCAVSMVGATFAQGLLNWNTAPTSNFIAQTNATQISPLFGGAATGSGTQGNITPGASGAGIYYQLLYGSQNTTGVAVSAPTTLLGLAAWTSTGLTATNTISASNGRITYLGPVAAATVPWGGNTDNPGQSNNIVMAGWSANLGLLGSGQETWLNVSNILVNWASTYQSQAVAGQNYFFGFSATGFLVGNDAPSSGASVFGPSQTANGLPIFDPAGAAAQMFLLPVPEPGTLALAGLGGLSLLLFRRQRK